MFLIELLEQTVQITVYITGWLHKLTHTKAGNNLFLIDYNNVIQTSTLFSIFDCLTFEKYNLSVCTVFVELLKFSSFCQTSYIH